MPARSIPGAGIVAPAHTRTARTPSARAELRPIGDMPPPWSSILQKPRRTRHPRGWTQKLGQDGRDALGGDAPGLLGGARELTDVVDASRQQEDTGQPAGQATAARKGRRGGSQ